MQIVFTGKEGKGACWSIVGLVDAVGEDDGERATYKRALFIKYVSIFWKKNALGKICRCT
jgi:hypothetical protein